MGGVEEGRLPTRGRVPQGGWTPLHGANEMVARVLLAAGADVNAKTEVSGWGGLGYGRAHKLFLFSWGRSLTAASVVLARVGEMSSTIDACNQWT